MIVVPWHFVCALSADAVVQAGYVPLHERRSMFPKLVYE